MSTELAEFDNRPPTMGKLQRIKWSHEDMIDFMLANPGCSQGQVAARYGYSQSWVSNIMASDAWQSQYAKRRAEMVDPGLAQTIEDRMKGLVIMSQERLMVELEKPACPPGVMLKALELGAKSLGLGQDKTQPQAPADLAGLAERLVSLQRNVNERVINGEAHEVSDIETTQG